MSGTSTCNVPSVTKQYPSTPPFASRLISTSVSERSGDRVAVASSATTSPGTRLKSLRARREKLIRITVEGSGLLPLRASATHEQRNGADQRDRRLLPRQLF